MGSGYGEYNNPANRRWWRRLLIRMIVQDMHNPGELSLHQSVRRMFLIASSMQTDAIHARKIALITTSLNIVSDIIDRIGEYGANIANIAKNSDKFNYIKISVSKKYE